jgi:hypothetical protein
VEKGEIMKTFLKFLGVFVSYMICFIIPGILLPYKSNVNAINPSVFVLTAYFFIMSCVFFYLLSRTELRAFRLIAAFGISVYGLQTFMTQIETWFFWKAFPAISPGELGLFFIRGLITMVLFAPLAALIMGKYALKQGEEQPPVPLKGYLWKFPVLGLVYTAVYFLFGYFIAWQSQPVRLLYTGSTQIVPFIEHMKKTFSGQSVIIPFQIVRGMLWTGLGVILLNLVRKSKIETIIALGLCFGLLPTIQLIFPNPYVPETVRLAHFIETSTSDCLFGVIIALMFYPGKVRP